jgi:glycosyltransferase involved in cell wall biosynthesis
MFNAEKTIINCLDALNRQTYNNFKVVIIDDGSTDSSIELVESFKNTSKFPIKLIKQDHAGPAKARNLGVEYSEGDIIVFLDSDCISPENWLEEMIAPLKGKIIGCSCGYRVKNKEYIMARYIDLEIAKRHSQLTGKSIDTIGTYSASFIKEAFKKAGGFDTNYVIASGEDFDFTFNLKKMGYDLTFTDKTFVYHYHPNSLRKYLKQQFWRGYWRVRLYLRNTDKIVKGDSYTGIEPQIQVILSSIMFLSVPFTVYTVIIPMTIFGILFLSNLPLGFWAYTREKKFIVIAPLLASIRSIAGTLGAYTYIIERLFK